MAYLPGEASNRISELREQAHLTQKELAEKIGVSPSTMTRIEHGETGVRDETMQNLARVFDVSVDFLLGLTDSPNKKNYEIGQLGLSYDAARAMITGKLNMDVLNLMLANKTFAMITRLIGEYFSGTASVGVEARNKLLSMAVTNLSALTKELPENADEINRQIREINASRIQAYEMNTTRIEVLFRQMLNELKRQVEVESHPSENMNLELIQKIQKEVMSTYEQAKKSKQEVTPEIISEITIQNLEEVADMTDDAKEQLKQVMISLMQLQTDERNQNDKNQ
ncbi:MAG: helix-turn-helix domain-containing protein [Lachnospiraceae bacterium]|nr:helix-turn-helix domain-containing protein [Lachnospiraceae bacterium]